MIRKTYWSSCEEPLFLSDLTKLEFLNRLSENTQISHFMKICSVGAEFLHVDGRIDKQTDMTKLIVTFRNLVNATKKFRGQDFSLSSV